MEIEILGTESLGVRGLCCSVTTADRRILIDPGVALGYHRQGLLPHPIQVAAGEEVRRAIVNRLGDATDVILSHFHGDHIPLENANPYQLALKSTAELLRYRRIWMKRIQGETPHIAERRRVLLATFKQAPRTCDGESEGPLAFSNPMPHGFERKPMGTVMMTRIQEGSDVFVHASDIQLLADAPVLQILKWSPTVLLASGPPIYRRLRAEDLARTRERARELARHIAVCILDHHLLRCREGVDWLDELRSESGGRILCAADYMKRTRRLLESRRKELYERVPVPKEWHDHYASGKTTTQAFRKYREDAA